MIRETGRRACAGGMVALSLLAPLAAGCLARAEPPPSRPPQFPSVRVVPAGEIRTDVQWFALSPDGSEIAVLVRSAAGRWRVQLRRLADGSIRRTLSGNALALRVVFSPDGSRLAVTCRPAGAPYLTMWSASDGRLLWSDGGFGSTGAAAFAPGGRTIAVPEWGRPRIHLLDVETGREIRSLAADNKDVQYATDLAFAPDGGTVACAAPADVRLYPVAGGSPSPSLILRSREAFQLSSLAFAPDGKTIVAGGAQGTLHRWRPHEYTYQDSRTVHVGAGDLRSVAYSPDGRFIAVASAHTRTAPTDDFIGLVNPGDGRLLWRADAHLGGAFCVAFAAGGKELVSAGADGTIKRWKVNSDAHGE